MMMLVCLIVGAALGAALAPRGYRGRHRMSLAQSWALRWEQLHPNLPWQRVRRRLAAARRARQRPHAHRFGMWRPQPNDSSWDWWLNRRGDYASALKGAGAW